MVDTDVKLSRTNRLLVPKDIRWKLGLKPGHRFLPVFVPAGILFRRALPGERELTAARPLPETEFSLLVRKDLEGDDSLPDYFKEKIVERAKTLRVSKIRGGRPSPSENV